MLRAAATASVFLLVAGCAPLLSGGLVGSSDGSLGASCGPANSDGEARLAFHGVQNTSKQAITLTSATLDRSEHTALTRSGFILVDGPGTYGSVGPYDGAFDGVPELTLQPGQSAIVDAVLRTTSSTDMAIAWGMVVNGFREDGKRIRVHTCSALVAAPAALACFNEDDDEDTYEIDYDYLSSVCTTE